ncbi:MAG: aspartate-alanine antiporter [Chromatiales bacterium]|nr:aspartate-alanine antiporter [Chromatiales bacterium]
MWHWLVETLRTYPEIAIFLTLGLGFWVGKFKVGTFSLGVVTSTLLAGVLVGQLEITISGHVKSTFFLMFLFAVGYGVGPQFFRGLKGDGIQQVLFAVIQCVAVLVTAVVVGKFLGYDAGGTAGLLAGSSTISAVLGVATNSIGQLGIGDAEKQAMLDAMPVAYAVTYLFGTAGSAWILASLGPKILQVDIAAECRKYEEEMGGSLGSSQDRLSGYTQFVLRAYRLTDPAWAGRTVRDFEASFGGIVPGSTRTRLVVERLRQEGRIIEPKPDTVLARDAVMAIAGRREWVLEAADRLGAEVDDPELLDLELLVLDVVVTNKAFAGRTLAELVQSDLQQAGRGVFLRRILRTGVEMPVTVNFKLERGDTVTLVGARADVERVAPIMGYADRVTEETDMVVMGAGIVIGALLGALTFELGGVPLSLSTSGGALIAGLVCGWLRSVNRTFGRIPAPALWVFNNIGLNTFIAVVGISAGPGFVAGLQAQGLQLFLAGLVVTTVPLVIGLLVGKYIFRMKAPICLGACAGARTTTAALGAIEAEAKSKVPALGYTVTYAVGNTLLTVWGVAVVLLMS